MSHSNKVFVRSTFVASVSIILYALCVYLVHNYYGGIVTPTSVFYSVPVCVYSNNAYIPLATRYSVSTHTHIVLGIYTSKSIIYLYVYMIIGLSA